MNCRECGQSYGNGGGHCTACHSSFTGDTVFDAHRVNDHGQRRCRTGDELRDRGFVLNERGWWGSPSTDPRWTR